MTDHTTVTVDEIPPCAFPHAVYTPAAYDGKTTRGPWAYMCQQHHILHGVGLGLGKGQRLVLKGASVITPITHPEQPESGGAVRTVILCLPLGYSAVCLNDIPNNVMYRYRVSHGTRQVGTLTYSPTTQLYGWFPVGGIPVVDITDPSEIPYGG